MSEIKQSLFLTLPGGLNTRHCLDPHQNNSPTMTEIQKQNLPSPKAYGTKAMCAGMPRVAGCGISCCLFSSYRKDKESSSLHQLYSA